MGHRNPNCGAQSSTACAGGHRYDEVQMAMDVAYPGTSDKENCKLQIAIGPWKILASHDARWLSLLLKIQADDEGGT
jgi:hypothetical protein